MSTTIYLDQTNTRLVYSSPSLGRKRLKRNKPGIFRGVSSQQRQQRLSRNRQRQHKRSRTFQILNAISAKMNPKRLVLFTVLLCLTFSCYCLAEVFTGNLSSLVWQAKNASSGFIAPYYHNVSIGNVWVLPSSKYDLGARDMTCECFDPGRKSVPWSCLSPFPFKWQLTRDILVGREMLYTSFISHRSFLCRSERNLLCQYLLQRR